MDKRDVVDFLQRVHVAVAAGTFIVTDKAAREVVEELGWDLASVADELLELQPGDYLHSERSRPHPKDMVHTFTPPLDDGELWIRLVERAGIIVVSFHRA